MIIGQLQAYQLPGAFYAERVDLHCLRNPRLLPENIVAAIFRVPCASFVRQRLLFARIVRQP
eukprot:11199813-Lingulodinium_polyedra.AAC.1